MALTESRNSELGAPAPDFALPGTDGRVWRLADFDRPEVRALVVVFMCNHCPYVIAVQDRINRLAREHGPRGVRLIGINANDSEQKPADGFAAMQERAREQGYVFPYLHDESQATARAYDAVCTPDPFVYERTDAGFRLRYHGRIDDCWKDPAAVKSRDLAAALDAILAGQPVNPRQWPAMGCSIKWRA
jgi:peroxiredoxin